MVLFYCPFVPALNHQGGAAMPRPRLTPKPKLEPEWESVSDTVAATGQCRATIYEKIALNQIDAVKDGKRLLINVASRKAHYASLPKAVITPRANYSKPLEAAE
jgi:hypothetical protein